MQIYCVIVCGARFVILETLIARIPPFTSNRAQTSPQGRRPADVRTHSCMFILHWEWIFAIFSAEWLLACVFTRLQQARLEHLQLLLLSLHVHCEIHKPMQSNVIGFQSLDLPL